VKCVVFFSICLAPLASALSMHLSHRTVIMVGGLLAASGMIIASLGLSLPWMYLSVGILQGKFCYNYVMLEF